MINLSIYCSVNSMISAVKYLLPFYICEGYLKMEMVEIKVPQKFLSLQH